MRSLIGLAALALSGSLGFASASVCHPGTPSTLTVKNLVVNGNLERAAPGPGEIYAFGVSGEGSQNNVNGNTANGNTETGCGQLTATGPRPGGKRKREVGATAAIDQDLFDLAPVTPYTVQFYYFVASSSAANTCWIEGFFGNEEPFIMSNFLSASSQWVRVVQSVRISSTTANFRFLLICTNGGTSVVYIDQIFVSNLVTPANIDSFIIDYDAAQLASGVSSVPVPTETGTTGVNTPVTPVNSATPSASDLGPGPTTPGGDSTPVPSTTVPSTSTVGTTTPPSENTPSATTTPTYTVPYLPDVSGEVRPPIPSCTVALDQGCSLFDDYYSGNVASTDCYNRGRFEKTFLVNKDWYPWQTNWIQCQAVCANMPDRCGSSAYDQASDRCLFSTHSITDSQFEVGDGQGYLDWTDASCVACPTCTEQVRSTSTAPSYPTRTCSFVHGEVCERATDIGDSLVCGRVGWLQGGGYEYSKTDYPYQESEEECAALCSTDPLCESSGFNPVNKQCYWMNSNLDGARFSTMNDPNWHSIWSDLACWSCPSCSQALASPTPGNPLATCGLTNGDGCPYKPSASISGLTCLEGGDVQGVGDPDSIFFFADIVDYPYQSSAEQCAAVCAQLDDCVSSTHDWKTNKCIFSPFTTTSSGFSDSRWNYGAWSDQSCFDCPVCDTETLTT